MKSVYICEDHPLFRQSLEQLIEGAHDLELVGSGGAVSEVIAQLSELKPDVILLDLNLSQGDGFEVLEFATQDLPDTKVAVLTSYNDKLLAQKARKAGASAYLLKDVHGEALLQSIRELDSGVFLSEVTSNEEESEFDVDREFTSILKLTRTEKKVVQELIVGASVSELSERFFISENTVKNHKKNIYRKLGVGSQRELILLCQKHGLLD